jgi:hypothetical protein
MKLPHVFPTWPWRRPRPTFCARRAELPILLDEVAEAPLPGCGWFDSSHDLQRGLLVTEHASADAVAAELPLDGWIGLHLAGWRPMAPRTQ